MAQQPDPAAEAGDDGRFEAVARRPGVENPIDAAVEIFRDMPGGRRADAAAAIGGRRHQRRAGRRDQRAGHFMRGHAQRQRIEPRPRQQRHERPRRRRDYGQRPRPEGFSQRARARIEAGLGERGLGLGEMGDQRIERRAALGGVDRRYRGIRSRQPGEAVDRLGRHGDQPALAQRGGGGGDVFRRGGRDSGGSRLRLRHSMDFRTASDLVYT